MDEEGRLAQEQGYESTRMSPMCMTQHYLYVLLGCFVVM